MVDLNESPGAWHGIAEGHVWLSDKERLGLALKACDLYLKRIDELEPAEVLVNDLADVLSHMVVGWEPDFGFDLAKHPEVVRVMALYRTYRELR
jgi:hypothetical protein